MLPNTPIHRLSRLALAGAVLGLAGVALAGGAQAVPSNPAALELRPNHGESRMLWQNLQRAETACPARARVSSTEMKRRLR